jgi:SAM-dependent methyltransferase
VTVTDHDAGLRTDRSYLRHTQYGTDANLAARQSIYAYQRPPVEMARVALDLAALRGGETVADIGCGNGMYLAELTWRGHPGRMLGVDLSVGMLRSARARAPGSALVAGDAAALPLADGACDVALAMHMLYHVPAPQAAVRELRRITRPGGRVLVGLNGEDHLRELRNLMAAALADIGLADMRPAAAERIGLDQGQELLSGAFAAVARHDFVSNLLLPGSEPIAAYVRSTFLAQCLPEPEQLVTAVTTRLRDEPHGTLRVRTHSGCLVCERLGPPETASSTLSRTVSSNGMIRHRGRRAAYHAGGAARGRDGLTEIEWDQPGHSPYDRTHAGL